MTNTGELDTLIDRARALGAVVFVKWDMNAWRAERRRIYHTIQVANTDMGPHPMAPIAAAEALRSFVAKAGSQSR